MGKLITAHAITDDNFDIVAAIDQKNHPDLGKDAGQLAGVANINVPVTTNFPDNCDVLIEFALPQASDKTIEYCADAGCALVMGTTGLDDNAKMLIEDAAKKIPVIYGTNMSVGMNVLFALVGKAADMLGSDYDIEIVEQHHKFKKDAPSGSAMTLAERICEATNRDVKSCLNFGRQGKDTLRKDDQIGIHAIRAGGIAGRHEVIYANAGETVSIGHIAHGREGFAKGALRAAEWLTGKDPGLYTMADVLGL
jgi:4-hydroxy-tetrahydrodipicolinate reductase